MSKRGLAILAGALACAFASSSVQAEVGKASAGPGEWFLGFNLGGGAAWGPERQAYITQAGPTDFGTVDFDGGAFFSGGVEIGYRFAEPAALVDRIELNVDLNMLSRDLDRDPALALLALADESQFSGTGASGTDTHADGNEDMAGVEVRLSFKSTLAENEDHALIASIEPFFRSQDTDSDVDLKSSFFNPLNLVSASRSDDIEAEYYGLQLALEMEKPLSESLSLVGRASAGAYHVTSDITSSIESFELPIGTPVEDSDSTWGGRFGGALGVKIPLYHTGASLTLLGTVDYMTDVATIDHLKSTIFQPSRLTQAGFDDQLELGGKVGLVFPLK